MYLAYPWEVDVVTPVLQTKKGRPGEVESRAQGHRAGRLWGQDLNPGSMVVMGPATPSPRT